jgi:rhodanese-related sulfurtransferase
MEEISFNVNPDFISQLEAAVTDKTAPLYFLCKTGGRSTDAAIAATAAGYTHCYNIEGGFEGDINTNHQRGQVNGWKASRLPWQQA